MKTEWVHKKLGECLTIGNGCDYKHLQHGDVPVYGTGGVMTYVDKYLYDGETVCIGRKGTINHPIYHNGKIWTVDTLFYTHSFLNVLPKFIYYTFCNIDWNKYNEATGVPSLSKETIYKIEIPIPYKNNKPDLSVQCRIAAILASADKVIAATQKTIAKYKQIKQGMMEDLLKPKEGWKMVKLGEVGEIVTGSTPTTTKLEYWDGEYNFYSPADFDDNVYCAKTDRTITAAGMKTGRPIPANSIMVACIASIGKIATNRTEGITNQQINTIIPNNDYDFIFLYYLLLFNVEKIKGKAAQTTIPIINKEDFSNLEFRVPDLGEQNRIASILLSVDEKIAAEQLVEEKYVEIKKGLMDKLLNEKQ